MRGEFKSDNNNNGGEHRQANNPHIASDPILINTSSINWVHANHKDHNGLDNPFHQPKEVIRIVKDGILLTNEIYFREQSIKVLVDLNVRRQVLLLGLDL